MQLLFRFMFAFSATCLIQAALLRPLTAQESGADAAVILSAPITQPEIPDAPAPQFELAQASAPQNAPTQNRQPAPDNSTAPPSNSTSSQPGGQRPAIQQPAAQTSSEPESQRQKSNEQLEAEKKQRVLGIIPAFNISYVSDAVSLTRRQKMSLAFSSAVDPFTFAAAIMVAGLHEAFDDDTGFGWGAEGLGKRAGAAYLDAFDGTMIGNGILPSLLHQDPRYFRIGHGTIRHRLLYSIATSYICKSDKTRRWEPNYSNVGGNIISGAISNLYYPSQNSGWGQTITNGFIVTTEGTIGGVFNEFWPDISRKFLHKDPTQGLDAEAVARDKLDKASKKQPEPPAPK